VKRWIGKVCKAPFIWHRWGADETCVRCGYTMAEARAAARKAMAKYQAERRRRLKRAEKEAK
jgi:uncharacterized membrane protein YvbJ